jgi:hypothetical protein
MKKRFLNEELPDFAKGDIFLFFGEDWVDKRLDYAEIRMVAEYQRIPDVRLWCGKLVIDDDNINETIGGVEWWAYLDEREDKNDRK